MGFAQYLPPPSQNENYFFKNIGDALDTYMKTYDKCIIAGGFNSEVSKPVINDFMGT